MSYILDALKKMEREKVKKARAGGLTNISGELFSEERPRRVRGGAGKIIGVAVVTSCIAMAATWYYLKPDKTPEKPAQRSASPAVPAVPAPAPVVPPVAPAPAQTAAPTAVPPPAALPAPSPVPASPPVARQQTAPAPPPAVAPSVPAGSVPVAQPAPRTAGSSRKEPDKQAAPAVVEQRPAVATIAPPTDIKVSGIAWQDERSARRAVVNGFLMKEGGVVSGARIVEIQKDRVRFSTPGGEFEASMVASGIPGASK